MEDENISEEDISRVIDYLLENGLMEEIAQSEDGTPLYRFSEELLDMPEFAEIHEALTNDMLFNIWQKGYIEMYPINEEGDWKIELCEKSYDMVSANQELEEDEMILFLQVFAELTAINEV
jgi:hypothetical protein